MSNVRGRRKQVQETAVAAHEWPRADPAELAKFDPATKACSMNCGKSALDPRTYNELRFLCDDCFTVKQQPEPADMAKVIWHLEWIQRIYSNPDNKFIEFRAQLLHRVGESLAIIQHAAGPAAKAGE